MTKGDDLIMKLLQEILSRLDGEHKTSWIPGKRGYRKSNGSALALLCLILGILLGIIAAALLR